MSIAQAHLLNAVAVAALEMHIVVDWQCARLCCTQESRSMGHVAQEFIGTICALIVTVAAAIPGNARSVKALESAGVTGARSKVFLVQQARFGYIHVLVVHWERTKSFTVFAHQRSGTTSPTSIGQHGKVIRQRVRWILIVGRKSVSVSILNALAERSLFLRNVCGSAWTGDRRRRTNASILRIRNVIGVVTNDVRAHSRWFAMYQAQCAVNESASIGQVPVVPFSSVKISQSLPASSIELPTFPAPVPRSTASSSLLTRSNGWVHAKRQPRVTTWQVSI